MFVCTAAFSFLVERTLYRPLYRATHLKQVLLTVGIIFVAVAAATCGWGPQQQPVIVPDSLSGQVPVLGLELSRYRLLLIAVGIAVTLALVFGLERTRFGARIRLRWTVNAPPKRWASMSAGCSSSRWRSAADWPASAARWA